MNFSILKMNLSAWMVVIGACLMLASCGEATEDHPIVGTWGMVDFQTRIDGETEWGTATQTSCLEAGAEVYETTEVYKPDGTHLLYTGNVSCNPDAEVDYQPAVIAEGTWRMEAADTIVVYTFEGAAGEYTSNVVTLNDSELILVYDTGRLDGTVRRNTYRRQ